jgi:hypothetical protein
MLPAAKIDYFLNLSQWPTKLGISTSVTQKTATMLADCKNTMNDGGRRHTMAAIVPHLRLQGKETLANMLCNKAT